MRDIDAHVLELAVTILEVTSDLHASRLEQHIAGKAALVVDTFTTLRLTEATALLVSNVIDSNGIDDVETTLRPLLDVFGDFTEIWFRLDDDYRRRLHEIETRALELIIATGRAGDSPF